MVKKMMTMSATTLSRASSAGAAAAGRSAAGGARPHSHPSHPHHRRGALSSCASTSRGREKDAWRANAPSQAPNSQGYYEEGRGGAPPPPPRGGNPSPLSANFWLPGGENLRNRRMVLTAGLVLGGSFFLRKLLPGSEEAPRVFVDDATGQRYLMTDGGNELALFEDEQGRPYFLDPKGNMWYDSGDPSIGIHRVSPDGDVFALWEDPKTGEVLEKRLGNIDTDLIDVKTKEYGDLTLFKDADPAQDVPPLCRDESGENLVKCLDAGGNIRADKTLEYPEVLLEGQIKNLERRKRVFGGGGKNRVGKGDRDVETFRQGDIGSIDLGLFD